MQLSLVYFFTHLYIRYYESAVSTVTVMAMLIAIYGAYFALHRTIPEFHSRAMISKQRKEKQKLFNLGRMLAKLLNRSGVFTFFCFAACAMRELGISQYTDFMLLALVAINLLSLFMIGAIAANMIHIHDKVLLKSLLDLYDAAIYLEGGRMIRGGLIDLGILDGESHSVVRLPDGDMTTIASNDVKVIFIRESKIEFQNIPEQPSNEDRKKLVVGIPQGKHSHRFEEFEGAHLYNKYKFNLVRMMKPTSNSKYVIARKGLIIEPSFPQVPIK